MESSEVSELQERIQELEAMVKELQQKLIEVWGDAI